jgi:hypothetical protein
MSVCRGARDLTFQYPCSCRFPPRREGNRDLVPPAGRGNLKEGGRGCGSGGILPAKSRFGAPNKGG